MSTEATRIPDTLRDLTHPIADLQPYPGNPRRGNLPLIVESLRRRGQYRPIVANKRTRHVLGGNHTLQAARELGWTDIAVSWVDVDDVMAAEIVAVDNRASDLAGYDDTDLLALLNNLPSLDATGYNEKDLDALLAGLTDKGGATDPDDVPPVDDSAPPHTQPGQLWQLGPHRLAVGDSTDPAVLALVAGDEPAELVWTDPPYGIAYTGKTADALTIQNDELSIPALTEFLRAAVAATLPQTEKGAAWYVAAPSGPPFHAFSTVLLEADIWKHTLVWVKDSLVMGRADYHYRHEVIFYGWTPGAARLHPVPDRKQDTVWQFARPKVNKDHPTMKPVPLIERALVNSCRPGGVVIDPFGGSGSTMIAAHRTGHRARLVELDPRYADVICRRYQQHTGTIPTLDGEPHSFTDPATD